MGLSENILRITKSLELTGQLGVFPIFSQTHMTRGQFLFVLSQRIWDGKTESKVTTWLLRSNQMLPATYVYIYNYVHVYYTRRIEF